MKLFRALLILLFAVISLDSWGAVKTDKLRPLDSNGVEVYAFDGTQIGEWDNATSYVLQILNGGLSVAGDANLQTSFTLDSQTITSVSTGAADNDTIATKGYIDDRDEANSHHGGLVGLADDDHGQYALLTGRSGDTLEIEEVQALTSAGLVLNNTSGSNVLTLGAGGGQGATFSDGVIVSNMLTANNGGGDYDFTIKKNGGTTAFLYDAGLDLFTASTNFVFDTTGYIAVPVGTEAQRPGTPTKGMFRFNDDSGEFEGYYGTAWGEIGGAGDAGGAGSPTTLQFFTADKFDVADLTTGNNASFNGGGTITASSLTEPSTPLYTGATTSFRYDPNTDGSNDYFGVELASIAGPEINKAQKISINYKTENASDGDFRLAVAQYDNTDTLIGSIDYVDVSASTTVKQLQHSFFLKDNVSYIRYGFQNTSTTTTIAMNFDKFVVDSAFGDTTLYNLTEWKDLNTTGIFTGFTPGVAIAYGKYRQVGNVVEGWIEGRFGATQTAGSALTITLPWGVDGSAFVSSVTKRISFGKVKIAISGSRFNGQLVADNTADGQTSFIITQDNSSSVVADGAWGYDTIATISSGDGFRVEFSYPVKGWSATTDAVVTEAEFNGHFVYYSGYTSKDSATQILFKTEVANNNAGLLSVTNTDHTRFTALKKVKINVTSSVATGTSAGLTIVTVYNSSGFLIYRSDQDVSSGVGSASFSGILEKDQYVTILSAIGTPADSVETNLSIYAEPTVQAANILTPKYEKSYNLTVTGTNWTNTDTPTGTIVKKYNVSSGEYEYWLRDVQIYGNLSVAASSLNLSIAGATFANTYSSGHGWTTDGSTQTDYVLGIGGTDDIEINLSASYSGNIAIGGSYKLASKPSETYFPGLE